jgi:hypothetical protein
MCLRCVDRRIIVKEREILVWPYFRRQFARSDKVKAYEPSLQEPLNSVTLASTDQWRIGWHKYWALWAPYLLPANDAIFLAWWTHSKVIKTWSSLQHYQTSKLSFADCHLCRTIIKEECLPILSAALWALTDHQVRTDLRNHCFSSYTAPDLNQPEIKTNKTTAALSNTTGDAALSNIREVHARAHNPSIS